MIGGRPLRLIDLHMDAPLPRRPNATGIGGISSGGQEPDQTRHDKNAPHRTHLRLNSRPSCSFFSCPVSGARTDSMEWHQHVDLERLSRQRRR
jgi:hypothetical protein